MIFLRSFISVLSLYLFYANDGIIEDTNTSDDPPPAPATDLELIYKQAPARIETTTMIQNAIIDFDSMIDTLRSRKKKANYLLAKEKCPAECDDNFKLIFLRCELFNIKLAVQRWLKYWDSRVETFGPEQAFLPLANTTLAATTALQYLQYSPNITDPDGRAILAQNMWLEANNEISSEEFLQAVWYQLHAVLKQDESIQKRGIVIYVRGVENFSDWRVQFTGKLFQQIQTALPIRLCGFHIMNPLSFINIVMKIIRPLAGKKLRKSFHIHNADSTAGLIQSLKKFGLNKDTLVCIINLLPTILFLLILHCSSLNI